ncbi:MAG TPA: peptidoglycan-binding domain-containing protein [Burkholderiales bacterium]
MTLRPTLLASLTSAALCGATLAQAQVQQWSQGVVRQAEQALARMNYSHGPIDGRMDADTQYGLRQVQASKHLAVTGGLNMETLAALGIEQSQYTEQAHRTVAEATPGRFRSFSPELVRRAEQALAQKQFVTGPIDGVLDAESRYGLRSFQQSMDLAATGDLNMETLEALGVDGRNRASAQAGGGSAAAGASVGTSTLYTPENIRAVEQALKDRNYVVGQVDTDIEPDTQYGLRQFQRDQGLAATGNFNIQTLERLGVEFGR